MEPSLTIARRQFHKALLTECLFIDEKGVASIADTDNSASKRISLSLLKQIGVAQVRARLAGQTAGKLFEKSLEVFIRDVYSNDLAHLRVGEIEVLRGGAIHSYQQYSHLDELQQLAKRNPEIATALGSDYLIAPDISIFRRPLNDEFINANGFVVDDAQARLTGMRAANTDQPILLASISCKWTIRSDRAQNSRSEALNLIKNRKGRSPAIAIVTAEPLPSRLSSIALGTGEVDMVYHFALPELIRAVAEEDGGDAVEQLRIMVEGKRLRDVSDLPLDLIG